MRNIIIIAVIILVGCAQQGILTVDNLDYVEARLSFYDPLQPDYTYKTWIRDPKNIRIAHESLKAFGYHNLYTEFELYDSPCWIVGADKYVLKPCKVLVDSLILTYGIHEDASKYFKEFWNRRLTEGNDSIVYQVLKEISSELYKKEETKIDEALVNDTVKNLLRIYLTTPTSNNQALSDFRFLKSMGLNLSAHNLLYEWTPYENIEWDRESLDKELLQDTMTIFPTPIIVDNSK